MAPTTSPIGWPASAAGRTRKACWPSAVCRAPATTPGPGIWRRVPVSIIIIIIIFFTTRAPVSSPFSSPSASAWSPGGSCWRPRLRLRSHPSSRRPQ
ncbi:hypothetical protein Tdes44962_MAKER09690 [Teratosphaeria destructans]|uniref:Uncharacterized protein n=1 Tax=Teratosphaeria destructans TaxID=418781 RepID=A0A9W7W2B4_9PEZI|nr:hypothetical protein Tdes44962_MAKER09690 [Teratosphaeria destructans]